MKRMLIFFLGLALFMAALWGGTYAMLEAYPAPDWRQMPILFTSIIVAFAGVVAVMAAINPGGWV